MNNQQNQAETIANAIATDIIQKLGYERGSDIVQAFIIGLTKGLASPLTKGEDNGKPHS